MVQEVLHAGRDIQKLHLLANTADQRALDLAKCVEALLQKKASSPTSSQFEIEDEIVTLLTSRLDDLEAIHIAVQITRTWSKEQLAERPSNLQFFENLRSKIMRLSLSDDPILNRDVRQILIRSFECVLLRDDAASTISDILSSADSRLLPDMRALASQVLTITRHISGFSSVKRSASFVFASSVDSRQQGISNSNTHIPKKGTALSPTQATGAPSVTRAQALLKILTSDDGTKEVARLQPKDFQAIGGLSGLSLQQFRCVCDRLRMRAVLDQWPRTALLDLARAPHQTDVTASVRTAMLGSLINEARKCGQLSTELEQQVYAISAEIPALSHLSMSSEPEGESLEDSEDVAA